MRTATLWQRNKALEKKFDPWRCFKLVLSFWAYNKRISSELAAVLCFGFSLPFLDARNEEKDPSGPRERKDDRRQGHSKHWRCWYVIWRRKEEVDQLEFKFVHPRNNLPIQSNIEVPSCLRSESTYRRAERCSRWKQWPRRRSCPTARRRGAATREWTAQRTGAHTSKIKMKFKELRPHLSGHTFQNWGPWNDLPPCYEVDRQYSWLH